MSTTSQLSEPATQRSPEMISPLLRVSLLLGVALHLAGFLIFRVVSSPLPDRVATRPYVEYVSAGSLANDRELEELAALFDSAPLFIPTRWNASQVMELDPRDRMQGQFPEFEPEIQLLSELQPSSFLVPQNIAVDKPLDLLASRFWRFFAGFAESPRPVAEFPDVTPIAEVSIVGQLAARRLSIPAELSYTTSSSVERPVLYYVRASGSGLTLSAPTLGQSSGNADFDRATDEWLRRPEVLGQLPQGYLSIKVFPW
tara:strand:+ start:3897 stop:4667 length:771 start_codon:yes stop_codon:yes gene_type:complete